MPSNQKDIWELPENSTGDDLVIGDIHGNADCLNEVIKTLKVNDRLFLVGDLTDRGENNVEVIKLLKENNERVIVIKGNHENLALNAIAGLERMALYSGKLLNKHVITDAKKVYKSSTRKEENERNEEFIAKYGDSNIVRSIKNGGKWLVKLFQEELRNGKITLGIDDAGNKSLNYTEDSDVKIIKDYMSSLPYIVHVKGSKPFNIVHADMPVNDQELQERIQHSNGELIPHEKEYATWAREKKSKLHPSIEDKGRTGSSTLSLVGHSMIDEGAPVIRRNTNTIDIDVGTYANDVSLVVNVSKGTCEFLGKGKNNIQNNIELMRAENELGSYLNAINQTNEQRCGTQDKLDEINKVIKKNSWDTGLFGIGGGKTIQIDGDYKKLPTRVAMIYTIINNPNLLPLEKLEKIKETAKDAITNPGYFQKADTMKFYNEILGNKTPRSESIIKISSEPTINPKDIKNKLRVFTEEEQVKVLQSKASQDFQSTDAEIADTVQSKLK